MLAGNHLATRGGQLAILAVLALGVSACGSLSLFGKAGPPPRNYDLSPQVTFAPGLPEVSWQLVVDQPYAANAIDTDRIAARTGASEIVYYKGVRWSDRAPRLIQGLLVESFEKSDRITAVGRQAIGLRSDYELKSDLREFQVDLTGGRAEVLVQMNFKLVRQPSAQIVAFMTAEQRMPAADDTMSAIVLAFDAALGAVMGEAVNWTLTTGEAHHAKQRR
jgi:cholesterol transport system auxiliary component